MTFSNWPDDIHLDPEQQKRIKSAKDAKLTPISIDSETGTGYFSGSSGRYTTTLNRCECGDFLRRRRPCKHIYRLAMELGLFASDGMKNDSYAIVDPRLSTYERGMLLKAVVDFVESTDLTAQQEIREMMYYDYKKELYPCEDYRLINDYIEAGYVELIKDYLVIFRHNTQKETLNRLDAAGFSFPDGITKKKEKFQWCIVHSKEVGPIAYPFFGALRPAGDLKTVKRKVYTYLKRKFDDDLIFDGEREVARPHGAETVMIVSPDGSFSSVLKFPDDEITRLLSKYHCNRCEN